MKLLNELNEAVTKVLEISSKINDETNDEVWDKAPLIIHQGFCHELGQVTKNHEKQKMDEVPEFMDLLTAIKVLEGLHPKLNQK